MVWTWTEEGYWWKDDEVGTARQEPGGRPKKRSIDVMKEEMKLVDVREQDAEDGVRWRQMIH